MRCHFGDSNGSKMTKKPKVSKMLVSSFGCVGTWRTLLASGLRTLAASATRRLESKVAKKLKVSKMLKGTTWGAEACLWLGLTDLEIHPTFT